MPEFNREEMMAWMEFYVGHKKNHLPILTPEMIDAEVLKIKDFDKMSHKRGAAAVLKVCMDLSAPRRRD